MAALHETARLGDHDARGRAVLGTPPADRPGEGLPDVRLDGRAARIWVGGDRSLGGGVL